MVTSAQKKATTKYEHNNYDKITLRIRKESEFSRELIIAAAASAGQSVNEFILEAVRDRMNNTTAKG